MLNTVQVRKTLKWTVTLHQDGTAAPNVIDWRPDTAYRAPLLQTFAGLMQMFEARLEEDELQIGLFRVPVPNYHKRAFREAFVNSLVHRDYTRLGAVHVRLENDGFTVSNPGGFVEGVKPSL
jgi:ATP-dependent DNA helicase RecG